MTATGRHLTRRAWVAGAAAAALLGRGAAAQAPPRIAPAAGSAPAQPRFDPARFVDECARAARGADAQQEIREIVARAMASPAAVLRGVGEPHTGGITTLYRSEQLTVLNIVWSPLMQLMPHEHRMWAVIGIYTGREDNIFWQRGAAGLGATGARALSAGDTVPLGSDVIHSVANPIERLTGAIHVYGGDFFAKPRSEWDPDTFAERPWDIKKAAAVFRESNERFAGWQARRACS